MRIFTGGYRHAIAVVAAILSFVPAAGSMSAAERQKQVLVLYSTRRDAQIAIIGERDLPRILDRASADGVDYYSEYLDEARFPDGAHQQAFRDFLQLKYIQQRFDVVIAIDDTATEFVERFRDDLFPAAPVVFFATRARATQLPNSTGIFARLDHAGSLNLAITLQPDARQVFVVTGAENGSREPIMLADVRAQFAPFAHRLTIEYLVGLPAAELERRLATLPAHSLIYYLSVSRDRSGQNFHPLQYLDRLASLANAPIYCWVDSAMNHGIVGGNLKSQENETKAVGEVALRVLQDGRADAIPTSSPDLSVSQVDWRQLRRWGIKEALVPAATLVRFSERSIWNRYRNYIVTALTILLAQTVLITGLVVQRARRQRAERQLRRREAELRTSYARIRQLARRLLNAQEDERSRIALELHDDIVQKLAVLAMELSVPEGTSPQELIDEALERVREITFCLRDLSHELHPAKLRLIGLVPALRGLQEEACRADVAIAFSHEHVPSSLPSDLTLCLFRIAQESMQNAIRHSRAHHVTLDLRRHRDNLVLTTVDDGVGFDVGAAWGKGLGLISMGERLEAFGGRLDIHSMPGCGTRIEATVPLPEVEIDDR